MFGEKKDKNIQMFYRFLVIESIRIIWNLITAQKTANCNLVINSSTIYTKIDDISYDDASEI